MRARFGIAAVLFFASAAHAQTRESQNMLPPSPFDSNGKPQTLTPPPPPPWDEALSTSGVDVATPARTTAPTNNARIEELERRIADLERDNHDKPSVPQWVDWLHPSLLIQPQLIWNFYNAAASPNSQGGVLPPGIGSNDVSATANGNTTNPDFFRLRRARLKLDFSPNEYASFIVEVEPVPRDLSIPGSGTIAREIEAIARFPIVRALALEIGGGSFEVPFGNEWTEAHGDRPFIERSYFQRNIFPGDFDLGMHTSARLGRHVDIEAAVINGRTFGELDAGGSLDLNRPKDFVLRTQVEFGGFEAAMSGYGGEGQLVDSQTLRFKQFTRLAYDAGLELHHRIQRLGTFHAAGEFFVGSNMDRGVIDPGNLPAMPADLTQDVVNRIEVGALGRIDQDLGRFITLGARYDVYSPDVNLANDMRHTFGAVLAFRLVPELHLQNYIIDPRVQFMIEYAHAIDTIRASGPQGAEKDIDTISFVLQGRL